MSLSEIKDSYFRGDYDNKIQLEHYYLFEEGHVFDEDKSVKWNREEAAKQNELIKKLRKEHNRETSRLQEQMHDDIIMTIKQDWPSLSINQIKKIEAYVYQEKHSSMCDYFLTLEIVLNLIVDVIGGK